MDAAQFRVPKHLNDPPRLLFWTMDEALLLFVPIFFGTIAHHFVLGLCAGPVLQQCFKRIKGHEGESLLLRYAYWMLPSEVLPFRAMPPSHKREYIG